MSIMIKTIKLNGVNLGKENPNVDIFDINYIHAKYTLSEECKKKPPLHLGEGMVDSMLPYLQIDNYSRRKLPKNFKVAIIENENLRATILLEYGGRLYSLYDKKHERELLYKNKVFQPCNLSLRNAWFSGGVEWNTSIKGHNPLTCSNVFAATTYYKGEQSLKIYEFERKRRIVYSVDFYLPKGSEILYVIPSIINTENVEKFAYWWSNIAFPQEAGTRVIVPADHSYIAAYNKNAYFLDRKPIPFINGIDTSYPINAKCSNDYFYDIPDDEEKWIVAIDKDGKGLFQASNNMLLGRKMFVWGNSTGGNNWQHFLSCDDSCYVEIQAGLCKTQLEHTKIPACHTYSWVEAYGYIDIGETGHKEFSIAQKAAKDFILSKFDYDLENKLNRIKEYYSHFELYELVNFGSGWGYLENLIRKKNNVPSISDDLDFPVESVGDESIPFVNLLKNGVFDEIGIKNFPKGYVNNGLFIPLLEEYCQNNKKNWYAKYHLGVIHYSLGDVNNAVKCWKESNDILLNPWSLRNIAVVESRINKNNEEATKLIDMALSLNMHYALVKDAFKIYIEAGKYQKAIDFCNGLPKEIQIKGRIKYFKAVCLTKLGQYKEASEIINQDFIMEDVRESELSISELYYDIYINLLLPPEKRKDIKMARKEIDRIAPLNRLDFRMHAEEE